MVGDDQPAARGAKRPVLADFHAESRAQHPLEQDRAPLAQTPPQSLREAPRRTERDHEGRECEHEPGEASVGRSPDLSGADPRRREAHERSFRITTASAREPSLRR